MTTEGASARKRTALSKRAVVFMVLGAFLVGVVAGAIAGIFGFIRVVGGSGEASQPITAPTLAVEPAGEPLSTEPTTTTVPRAGEELSGQVVFHIISEESEVRYIVAEQDPLGTVIGITNQGAGDVLVDFDHPAASEVGTIRVNVRTLQTDIEDRDQSVRAAVLESARPEYEFAEFTPTRVQGLTTVRPELGKPMRVRVAGDLTVHGITRPLSFSGTVTVVSVQELRGFLAASISLPHFELMHEALAMHLVSEEMILEVDFVARPAER